eukprot:833969-Pyramimonas_sp.AAC.1
MIRLEIIRSRYSLEEACGSDGKSDPRCKTRWSDGFGLDARLRRVPLLPGCTGLGVGGLYPTVEVGHLTVVVGGFDAHEDRFAEGLVEVQDHSRLRGPQGSVSG